MYKVLLVEDDAGLARSVAELLRRYSYDCTVATDFDDVVAEVRAVEPHLVLLDVNLPRYDGFYWCREIRAESRVPIIVISARDASSDQVRGIESGADDYLVKPFDPDVLLAKVAGVLRRSFGELSVPTGEQPLEAAGLSLLFGQQLLRADGQEVSLSLTEARLLKLLLEAHPSAASRAELFVAAWDAEGFVEDNTLNVNIRRLREKLAGIAADARIQVVRGLGYRLVAGGGERDGQGDPAGGGRP